MSFLSVWAQRLRKDPNAPTPPKPPPKPKKHSTGFICQSNDKCPACGSPRVATYRRAFIQITEFAMAKCCECEACGGEFHWKVPAVMHQLEAWKT